MQPNTVCNHNRDLSNHSRCTVLRFFVDHSHHYRPNWIPLSPSIAIIIYNLSWRYYNTCGAFFIPLFCQFGLTGITKQAIAFTFFCLSMPKIDFYVDICNSVKCSQKYLLCATFQSCMQFDYGPKVKFCFIVREWFYELALRARNEF